MDGNNSVKTDIIDAAIAAAKERKARKVQTPATEPAPKREKLTDEQKVVRDHERDVAREAARVARAEARAQKQVEMQTNRKPAHMKKVEKAAERLGSPSAAVQLLLNEATTQLSAQELQALANHLLHFNRVKATERAIETKLEPGMSVCIISGDPRFIGKVGTIARCQRIRCYVTVEGLDKPVYLFTSDVQPTPAVEETIAVAV